MLSRTFLLIFHAYFYTSTFPKNGSDVPEFLKIYEVLVVKKDMCVRWKKNLNAFCYFIILWKQRGQKKRNAEECSPRKTFSRWSCFISNSKYFTTQSSAIFVSFNPATSLHNSGKVHIHKCIFEMEKQRSLARLGFEPETSRTSQCENYTSGPRSQILTVGVFSLINPDTSHRSWLILFFV